MTKITKRRHKSNISLPECMLNLLGSGTKFVPYTESVVGKVFSLDSSAVAVVVSTISVTAAAFLELILNRSFRCVYNAVASGIFPFAVTAFLSLFHIKPVMSAVLTAALAALIVFGAIRFRKTPKQFLCFSRNALSVVLSVSLLMAIGAWAGIISLYPVQQYTIPTVPEPPTISQSQWSDMNTSQRSAYLSEVFSHEAYHLGLEPPKLVYSTLPSTTYGKYTNEDRCVFVQAELLSNGTAEELTLTVIHELQHCWQKKMVELYKQYKETEYVQLYPFSLGRLIYGNMDRRKTSLRTITASLPKQMQENTARAV